MPGKRQTTDTIIANGRKHLSKNEEAERRASEVHVPVADTVTAPAWLSKKRKTDFVRLGEQLRSAGLYSEIDADTLAAYVVAYSEWQKATKQVDAALREKDAKASGEWSNVQDRFFRQARAAANDLGLTITSRCRLVMPQQKTAEVEDLDEFTAALMARQKRAAGG